MSNKKIVIIGAGFAGLSAASFLAKAGCQVTVLEKNSIAGGRARVFSEKGFRFDMGPSWYWMPDVFERYFSLFGKNVSDYYQLYRLNPSYRIYWEDSFNDISADYNKLKDSFEQIEPGSSIQLDLFLKEAAYKYEVGINKLVHKPSLSITEFLDTDLMLGIIKLDVFNSIKSHISKKFKNKKLQTLLEFPVLFLGALPENTPALYSLMNYADIKGGTWYPEKGMYSIVTAMYSLAKELGVNFYFEHDAKEIVVENKIAKKVIALVLDNNGQVSEKHFDADVVIGAADYHHVETKLLQSKFQSYSASYWESRVMAPSCIIFYLGLNKKLEGIQHHSLFFDTSFETHGKEIYTTKEWPTDPLFYLCTPSATDHTVAPENCENLFILIPVATGLENDSEEIREKYFQMVLSRMEKHFSQPIRDSIIFKKSYAQSNFLQDYNAFKGNAYGLANTLLQTAFLKPSCRSKKVNNLFYTGQLTVPGPGVPPSLISGEVISKVVMNTL